MANKYLFVFGHGKSKKTGRTDTGATYKNFTEQEMVRRLRPFIKKWADKAGIAIAFYDNDMYADRAIANYKGWIVIEIHLDAPNGIGGHVIIDDELNPDDMDKRLAAFIKELFGLVGYVGKDGINKRDNLYNVNTAENVGINFRLLELFFLSNETDRNYYINNLDFVAKKMLEAVINKTIGGKPASNPVNKPAQVSKTLVVGTQAKQWQTGQNIPSFVINGTYDILGEKAVNQSNSKKAFLIGKGTTPTGWLLEQDVKGVKVEKETAKGKTISQLVKETLAGVHGNGDSRKKSLGSNYDAVMKVINSGSKTVAKPATKNKRVYLPRSAKTWRVYRTPGPYTTGKEVGFLAPAQYGGLDYEIIKTLATDVYEIKTGAFGNVAIYAAKSTGATIK